jgi:redox-sensing transcriptional repressor
VLSVPSGVDVRKVDLSIELQILAFHAQRRSAGGRPELAVAEDAVAASAVPATTGPDLNVTEIWTGAQAIAR